jgi:hypothetical protein
MRKNILCRVVCNRRTIVQQMPMNATFVTGLSHDGHIADTGVERKTFLKYFLKWFLWERMVQPHVRAHGEIPISPRAP